MAVAVPTIAGVVDEGQLTYESLKALAANSVDHNTAITAVSPLIVTGDLKSSIVVSLPTPTGQVLFGSGASVTSSPNFSWVNGALTVASSTEADFFASTTSVTAQLYAAESQAAVYLGARSNHPLILTVNNAEKARLDTTGLGVGAAAFAKLSATLAGGDVFGLRYAAGLPRMGFYLGVSSGAPGLVYNAVSHGSSYLLDVETTGMWHVNGNAAGIANMAWGIATGTGTAGTDTAYTSKYRLTIKDTGEVGVNTTAPLSPFHVVGACRLGATSATDYVSGTTLYVADDYATLNITNSAYDSGGAQMIFRSKGSGGSGVTASGDWIGFLGVKGYYSGAWEGLSTAAMYAVATENHTSTAQGTRWDWDVTAIGASSRAPKMSLTSVGLGVGTIAPTSPAQFVGLGVHANNAAAVAAGLTAGAFYRTGADPDPVMVVH